MNRTTLALACLLSSTFTACSTAQPPPADEGEEIESDLSGPDATAQGLWGAAAKAKKPDLRKGLVLPGPSFFPEGIAVAKDGTFYVGSIGTGAIVRSAPGAKQSQPFVPERAAFGVHGLAVDEDREVVENDIGRVSLVAPWGGTGHRIPIAQGLAEPTTAAIHDHPLPSSRALRVGIELARGLGAAHDKGIVHRDIKPAAAATAAPSTAAASPPEARPTYRPLTFRRGQVTAARFSADGHTVVYGAAWEGAPGEIFTTRIDAPGSRALGVTADLLAVSARGDLAILLDPSPHEDHMRGTLARLPLGGGAPRPVAGDVQGACFGPGGEQLAVVRKVSGRSHLEYPIGKVRHETGGWLSHLRVSPDGRRIAFVSHDNPKDDRGSIFVLEDGGAPRELSADWASAQGLAWAPGGDEVWFTASKTDANNAIWAVDLAGRSRLVDRVAGRLLLHDTARRGSVARRRAARAGRR